MDTDLSRIYAVIIGIDEYLDPDTPNLRGAVADANSIDKYLTDCLRVPPYRIWNLRNSLATRDTIMRTLLRLADDPQILKDDPILIYYAGQNAFTPHDFKRDGGIPALSYRVIFRQTVILDCCRQQPNGQERELRSDSDSDLFDDDSVLYSPQTFTLLAACGLGEIAREKDGKGVFTVALLQTLYGSDDITSMTYADLLRRLPALPHQNAQCEGNANRIIFTKKIRDMGSYYHVQVQKEPQIKLLIEAGKIHGIKDNTTFSLWTNLDLVQDAPLLCEVKPSLITPFKTEAKWQGAPTSLPPFLIAKAESMEGPVLNVYVPQPFRKDLEPIFQPGANEGLKSFSLLPQPSKELADIGLSLMQGSFLVDIFPQPDDSRSKGKHESRLVTSSQELWRLLSHLAFFLHHLRHTNPPISSPGRAVPSQQRGLNLMAKFRVEVYLLRKDRYGDLVPSGDNLNLANSGVYLTVPDLDEVDEEDFPIYGFKIVNESAVDVYPLLFYFNMYDLSIDTFYKPEINGARKIEAPLKSRQSIMIGSARGTEPRGFVVDEKTNVENGYLKLYITTEPVELSFPSNPGQSIGQHRGIQRRLEQAPQIWGTIQIPFIIERQNDLLQKSLAFVCVRGTKSAKASILHNLLASAVTTDTQKSPIDGIEVYTIALASGSELNVVDLPGFESDSLEKNAHTVRSMTEYFTRHTKNSFCRGLIFAYDISKPWVRVRHMDELNLRLLKDICGDEFQRGVTFVTTNWDQSYTPAFDKRATDLETSPRLWKPFLQKGAKVMRYQAENGSAEKLVSEIFNQKSLPLAIQEEAEKEKPVFKMAVVATMRERLERRIRSLDDDIADLANTIKQLAAASIQSSSDPSLEASGLNEDKRILEEEKADLERVLSMVSEVAC